MTLLRVIPPAVQDQACRMCGARRRSGETDDQWISDRQVRYGTGEMRRKRDDDGSEYSEVTERPWHRRHVDCEPDPVLIVAELTGIRLDPDQAAEVLNRHGISVTAGDRQAAGRRPWEHIGRSERAELTAIAAGYVAQPDPAQHTSGRCGVCGASRSARWTHVGGLLWSDHTPTAACSSCAALMPLGTDLDLLRLRSLGALAGVRTTPSLRAHGYYGFRFAAEVLTGDERHEDGAEPWQYRSQALERVRQAVCTSLPELLLDEAERAAGIELLMTRRARAATDEARRMAQATPGADAGW